MPGPRWLKKMDAKEAKPKPLTADEKENMRYFAQLRGEPEPRECRLVECDDCEGHGTIECNSCEDGSVSCRCSECDDVHDRDCDECGGKGNLGQCQKCLGTGEVEELEEEPPPEPPVSLPLPFCYWITR